MNKTLFVYKDAEECFRYNLGMDTTMTPTPPEGDFEHIQVEVAGMLKFHFNDIKGLITPKIKTVYLAFNTHVFQYNAASWDGTEVLGKHDFGLHGVRGSVKDRFICRFTRLI